MTEDFLSKSFKLNDQDITLEKKASQPHSRVTITCPEVIPMEQMRADNLIKSVRKTHKKQSAEDQETIKSRTVTLTFVGKAPSQVKTQFGNFKTTMAMLTQNPFAATVAKSMGTVKPTA